MWKAWSEFVENREVYMEASTAEKLKGNQQTMTTTQQQHQQQQKQRQQQQH